MLLQLQLQYETVEEIAIVRLQLLMQTTIAYNNCNCNNIYQKVGDIAIHQHVIVKKELKLKMIV